MSERAQRVDMSDEPSGRLRWTDSSAERILGDINTLASASTNAAERSRIVTLLTEEETKFS